MSEEPHFECKDLVEFHEEFVREIKAPQGVFRVREVHRQRETQVILYLTLRPIPVFDGKRVDMVPPNMLKKAKTAAS